MAITPLPVPVPTTSSPSTFDARADAFLGALPAFATEANLLAAQVVVDAAIVAASASSIAAAAAAAVSADAAGFVGSSNTTLSVGAGDKSVTLQAAKPNLMAINRAVVLVNKSDPTIRMFGSIAASPAPTSTTAKIVVTTGGVFGSGSYSDWHLIDAAFFAAAATAAEIWAGATDAAAVTPKSLKNANVATALAYSGTVTPNLATGRRFTLTASASFTLGAPTGASPGDVIEIDVTNSAGSVVLAVNTAWKRQGGLGIIGPNNADRSTFYGVVQEVNGSGVMTRGLYNVIRTPT